MAEFQFRSIYLKKTWATAICLQSLFVNQPLLFVPEVLICAWMNLYSGTSKQFHFYHYVIGIPTDTMTRSPAYTCDCYVVDSAV